MISKSWAIISLLCLGCVQQISSAESEPLIPIEFVNSHLKGYSPDEVSLIQEDLAHISKTCFRGAVPASDRPIYVATAGGPGASKSTILETYLADHRGFVYADPDPRALDYMINTYRQSRSYYAFSKNPKEKVLNDAYEKWRPASNYIACTILNDAFAKGYHIAHGTTSTAPQVKGLYERLKSRNYKIVLLLCGSTDKNRIDSLTYRAKELAFIQNSDEDTITKGKAFPERFPVYFGNADEIIFYWTADFSKGNIKAATLTKENGLTVHDQTAYNDFLSEYKQVDLAGCD